MHVTRKICAALAGMALALSMVSVPAQATKHTVTTVSQAEPCFVVYDNTFYYNFNLGATIGIPKANILYPRDGWEATLMAGNKIDKEDYQDAVEDANDHPGPFIINIEGVWLAGLDTTLVEKRAANWIELLQWTEEVLQGSKPIGIYHFHEQVRQAQPHVTLARQVSQYLDIYVSSDYTASDNLTTWNDALTGSINRANYLDASKPFYSYIWPNYFPNTQDDVFITPSIWQQQLDILRQRVDSVVIWSSSLHPTITRSKAGWIGVTDTLVDTLPIPPACTIP